MDEREREREKEREREEWRRRSEKSRYKRMSVKENEQEIGVVNGKKGEKGKRIDREVLEKWERK